MAIGEPRTGIINSTNTTYRPPSGRAELTTLIIHGQTAIGVNLKNGTDTAQLSVQAGNIVERHARIEILLTNSTYLEQRGSSNEATVTTVEKAAIPTATRGSIIGRIISSGGTYRPASGKQEWILSAVTFGGGDLYVTDGTNDAKIVEGSVTEAPPILYTQGLMIDNTHYLKTTGNRAYVTCLLLN